MYILTVYRHFPAVEVQFQRAYSKRRLTEPLAASRDCLHPRQEFKFVERFRNEIIGAHTQAFYFRLRLGEARKDQYRRFVSREPHTTNDFIAVDVGENKIEQHNVIFIMPSEVDRLF